MSFDYSLGASLTALILASAVAIAHRRFRVRSVRERALLKKNIESLSAECHAQLTSFDAANAAMEASLASTRTVLADGRFSNSRRTEALRLLRAGASPEMAAKTLGVARSEMRLLASVYAALTSK